MQLRPATMITAVVVAFAVAGVVRMASRNMDVVPRDGKFSRYSRADVQPGDFQPPENDPPGMADRSSAVYQDSTLAALKHDTERAFDETTAELNPEPVAHDASEELLRAIDAIETLAKEGRRTCNELGEPFYEPDHPGPDGEEHMAKWSEFARAWDDDVSRAASHMPSPPSWNADPELLAAYQDVSASIGALRAATLGNGDSPVPSQRDWAGRFDEASRLLREAKTRLSTP